MEVIIHVDITCWTGVTLRGVYLREAYDFQQASEVYSIHLPEITLLSHMNHKVLGCKLHPC